MTPRQHRKRERRQAYWRELSRRSQARTAQMEQLRAEWAAQPVALPPLTFIGWVCSEERIAT